MLGLRVLSQVDLVSRQILKTFHIFLTFILRARRLRQSQFAQVLQRLQRFLQGLFLAIAFVLRVRQERLNDRFVTD